VVRWGCRLQQILMMKKQQALDIGYDKTQGALKLDQLNQLLAEGWTVVDTATSGGGDILVIVEKDDSGSGEG
jgi:hypothetical protein